MTKEQPSESTSLPSAADGSAPVERTTTKNDGSSNIGPSQMFRWVVNLVSCLSVFLFSGIIYGWAPLYLILVAEGQYSEVCTSTPSTDITSTNTTTFDTTIITCPQQDLKLGNIFTLGQFLLNFSSLPVGFMLDHIPKTVFYAICGTVNVIGLVLFAMSDTLIGRDYFHLSYAFLAFSGSMTMLGAFPTTFLLPQYQAALLAAISCLFDASSITFFVFYEVVLNIGMKNPTGVRQRLFYGWAMLSVLIFTILCILWSQLEKTNWKDEEPVTEVKTDATNDVYTTEGLIDDTELQEDGDESELNNLMEINPKNVTTSFGSPQLHSSIRKEISVSDRKRRRSYVIKDLQSKDLRGMVSTVHFGLASIFASISMLRINFYILTVDTFLLSLGDTDSRYAEAFSWILPSGLIFVPVIDWTANQMGVINTLRVTNAIGIVFGAVLLIPSLVVQACNFIMLTGYRAFVYAVASVFIAQTFGVVAMGRIFGSCFFIAAMVSLLQAPMAVVTQSVFDGNFYPINCFNLGLAMIPTVAVEAYQRWERQSEKNLRIQDNGNNENGKGRGNIKAPLDNIQSNYGSIQS